MNAARDAIDFYRANPVMDRRIHIIGVGNVGTFVAHALRGIPNPPPVTLIFARRQKRDQWEQSAKKITLVTDGDAETRDGYDVEFATPRTRFHGQEVGAASTTDDVTTKQKSKPQTYEGESNEPISSLIICSKTPHVLQHLSAIKHRLTKRSVILFLQNGMGTTEEVSKEIFPDPATRPYYMLGINSHGLNNPSAEDFTTTHAGFGTILLGIVPHERARDADSPYLAPTRYTSTERVAPTPSDSLDSDYATPRSGHIRWTSNQRYLLRTMLRSPVLSASAFSPSDLLQLQLEKLVANCIINPLTVLLDARNGSILYNYAISRTMRLLLAEISLVIRSLPELQYIPNVQTRFDPGRLETVVVGVANKTKDNISSMLADVRAGRQTEIDYINGWVVRRGEELGIRCVMNYMLMQMVKGKQALITREMGEDIPALEEEKGQYEIDIRAQSTKPKEKL